MSKIDDYRHRLRALKDWDEFLLKESGLPGPRGNIELGQAVADEGNKNLFERYLLFTPEKAPVNSPYEFLAFCGVLGFGRLLAGGDFGSLKILRAAASDPRWRVREGVAMGLQRWGEADMAGLLAEMGRWSRGKPLEQRAAVAALCEPKLLHDKSNAQATLKILDDVTASILSQKDRKSGEFIALRKGLGYGWSVAVVALPDVGKRLMEKWFSISDRDVRWIMRENLKKNRLMRMDADWVGRWQKKLA